MTFHDYKVLCYDHAIDKRGRKTARDGGIVKDELMPEVFQVISDANSQLETLWIKISGKGVRAAVIGVVYRAPDAAASTICDDLRDQLEDILPIFLLGDTNLDLLHAAKPGVYQYMNISLCHRGGFFSRSWGDSTFMWRRCVL